ncbi:MAG: DUF192 domain-containing protein [Nanoarchaeota archaeon]|nr:DUF192 domain-containing protein [Nanoarchaeota archaeon]MBU1632385.1 DUF192 domain-containing protein [Nanoarchaeota archaeon]MBU1876689.1 DUF192 domain-containing protein [Nanoarchaeota archaeon]
MIINKTKNKIISEKEIVCRSGISQARGLMFRKRKNLIMIFNRERKISLHNFFVFYPIDILVLNNNKIIVEIKRNFRPFTLWNSKKRGSYLIELGFTSDYELGDRLNIKLNSKF